MTAAQNALLKRVFIQAYTEEYELLAAANTENVFSKKFEKKIQKLIDNLDSYWTYVSKRSKRTFAVLIAAVLLFAGSMSVTAFRESFLNFVINVYETFTEIFVKDEQEVNNDEITTFYSLGYVPEGYIEVNSNISETFANQEFVGDKNAYLVFEQMPLSNKIITDTELTVYQEVQIGNISIYISSNKGQDVIVWRDDQYFYTLNCYPSLELLEIKKIITGITIISN